MKELSIGEYRVDINPLQKFSGNPQIDKVKSLAASMIDAVQTNVEDEGIDSKIDFATKEFITLCKDCITSTTNPEAHRCFELAIANVNEAHRQHQVGSDKALEDLVEAGAMWAVKGITKPNLPENFQW